MDAPFGKQYLLIALRAVNRVKQKYQWNKKSTFREGVTASLEVWLVILAR